MVNTLETLATNAANFVRDGVAASVAQGATTISVSDASIFPDTSTGNYHLVVWDSATHPRPDQDPDVEIVEVTAVDTANNDLTVTRGQEGTTDVSHPSSAEVQLSPTAGLFDDIATQSVTVAGNSVSLGGSTGVDYIDLGDTGSSFPIPNADLSNSSVSVAGNSVSLGGSTGVDFADLTGEVTDSELGVDPFVYSPGMTEFETGLSNEEIDRLVLQTGETLVVERIEFRQKGGGSSTSASIDVRDTTAASTVGSQNLGGTTKDPGSSGSGNTVIVRLNNSTGSSINAAPRVQGYITGV
jgi:hypothetical protein